MGVMILEDNFLVGEMMRLAVEDAKFDVIGPASTVEEAEMLLDRTELDGAFLDIRIRDADAFPVARALKSRRLPFVFVSSYDRTILPPDLRDEPLIHKPATVRDISRLAADRFSSGAADQPDPTAQRTDVLRRRIASAQDRILRQQRRVERLRIEGHDHQSVQLAADLLDQMEIAAGLMRQVLQSIENRSDLKAPASGIDRPISDGFIDIGNPRELALWAETFSISPKHLTELVSDFGPSAYSVRRALGQAAFTQPARRACK